MFYACFLLFSSCEVIGEVGALELISPTSSTSLALIQWKAPDVLFENSSPLYYNITVRNSFAEVIAQTTTTDTSFPIDSDLLVSCDFYQLTMLPFQKISSKTELGIVKQETFFPPPLPPTNVNLNVSIQTDSAKATIYFQVYMYVHDQKYICIYSVYISLDKTV